ncbi:MAG: hypothetical protein WDO68_29145 [Gammaproteobacteria bacterium]
MRRFFLFAVLWAALFGPGHVLAACPMALAADHGTHAPCHSDGDRDTATVHQGHDCCAWVSPSSASGKLFLQKSDGPFGDLAPSAFAGAALSVRHVPPLTHPPPLPISRYALRSSAGGSDTFLRTGRLRL